jgi:hypothetical protein
MKVIILVPSQEYMGNAGARIRYGRLSAEAGARLEVTLEDIAQFDPRTAVGDFLVISKCHDARSLLAAKICARRGFRVGVDLFDDYFSQSADSRLNRFRVWLQQLLALCDFAMCSTALMADVVATYCADIPVYVLNDPAPPLDFPHLSGVLAEKLSDARVEGRLRVAWFGVGDNPNFPVGLSDVAAFADSLAQLGGEGRAVELAILTNVRSLDAARLAMIASLPVPTTVGEWSEEAEAELLRTALACFLPVNAQQFSAAKSLNRAVTALAAGCQVLSVGYPLYRALDAFLYRDVCDLVDDVRAGRLRLSPDTLEHFRAAIEAAASPAREAEAFIRFLAQLPAARADKDPAAPLFLVHGYATNGAAHKMVQAVGGLSVASPFCPAPLDYDVVFQARPGREVVMLVSDKGLSRMRPELRARAAVYGPVGKRNFWEVRDDSSASPRQDAWANPSLSLQLALYPSVMKKVVDDLAANFGPGCAIISENSTLPFEPVV